LYIPVLIYGSGAIADSMLEGTTVQAYLLLLGAFLIFTLVFSPWATAAAVRISSE
ncbi:MAG TPA: heme exporter protein CcmB, partial [Thiotrichales bacterium]|nr:heme exporter protein CcmB [Thiotrichales bacterium]